MKASYDLLSIYRIAGFKDDISLFMLVTNGKANLNKTWITIEKKLQKYGQKKSSLYCASFDKKPAANWQRPEI